MKNTAPVSRDFIVSLLDRIDRISYGISIAGGLDPGLQRIRNKALVSILYLSARRVSELVGRSYGGDVWEGINVSDFREDAFKEKPVLIFSIRILKKGSLRYGLKDKRAEVILDKNDEPFMSCLKAWIEHQRECGIDKLFGISRQRVYQILLQIDPSIVGSHWFRHQRLSHLAEELNPFQLNERLGFWESLDPAIAYVHGRVSSYLEAIEKTR